MADIEPHSLIAAHIAADGVCYVKVTAGADRDSVASGVDVNGRPVLLVRLRAKAVDGAANKGLVAYLAKELGIAKSRIVVEQGTTSRQKRLRVMV